MKKMSNLNFSDFFEENTDPQILAAKKQVVIDSVADNALVEEAVKKDYALALLTIGVSDRIAGSTCLEAFKNLVNSDPIIEKALSADLSQQIQTQLDLGKYKKAQAYMACISMFKEEAAPEEKRQLSETLNFISGNTKLSPMLRTRAFVTSLSLNMNDTDEAFCATLSPITQEVRSETFSCCRPALEKISSLVNNKDFCKCLEGKPGAIEEMTFLLSYQSSMLEYTYHDQRLEIETEEREDFLVEKQKIDQSLQVLSDLDFTSFTEGKAYGQDRFKSYVLRVQATELAETLGAKLDVYKLPFGYLMTLGNSGRNDL